MKRAVIAVLAAPQIAAILIVLFPLLWQQTDWEVVEIFRDIQIVSIFAYMVSLVPAALTLWALKWLGWTRLWQFVAAGFALSVFCSSILVLLLFRSYVWTSFDAFLSKFLESSLLLLVGPIVGLLSWYISEARYGRN